MSQLEKHVNDALRDVEYNLYVHDNVLPAAFQPWHDRKPGGHIWKAVKHLFWYTIGNTREPHLTHAATRLLFALQLHFETPPGKQPGVLYGEYHG